MPIRFRCPGCEGLLSIARRKAGQEITCPKCSELVIVPPLQDDATELDMDPIPEKVVVTPPPPKLPDKPPKSAPVLLPSKSSTATAVKSKEPGASAPLFERADFVEKLLTPAVQKATAEPAATAGPKPASEAAGPLVAHIETGVFVSRGTVVMLCVVGMVMLALAFAIGYFVGSS